MFWYSNVPRTTAAPSAPCLHVSANVAACLHWTHKSVSWQMPLCIFFGAKSQKPKLPFLYNLVNYTDGKLRWILAPPFCHILQIYLQLESYKRFILYVRSKTPKMYSMLSAFTAQLNIAPVKNSVLKIGPTNLNYIPLGPRGGDNGVIVIIQGLAPSWDAAFYKTMQGPALVSRHVASPQPLTTFCPQGQSSLLWMIVYCNIDLYHNHTGCLDCLVQRPFARCYKLTCRNAFFTLI